MKVQHLTVLILTLLTVLACGSKPEEKTAAASNEAQPIGFAECAACGMVVAEQPAPRGQLVHRNGERVYFCSIGDMLAYQNTPSPHGRVVAVYVEVMDGTADPLSIDPTERAWRAAEETHFVLGVPRNGIMGPPVMSYTQKQAGVDVAKAWKGDLMTWSKLQQRH